MGKKIPHTPIFVGSSSFVASEIIRFRGDNSQDGPSSQDLDITNPTKVSDYFSLHASEVVVNFAAYTNVKEAEAQRNDYLANAWKINVEGVKNLARAANKYNKFLIQISTDSVFPTGLKSHGPYSENDQPVKESRETSWYGYTKLMGEKAIQEITNNFAIVRIAYPFSNPQNPKDYTNKLVQYMKNGYSLFSDQNFTPTYLPDLQIVLDVLISTKQKGIYHVATHPSTTPYQLGHKIAKTLNMGSPKKSSLKEYLKNEKGFSLYASAGGLNTLETQKRLGLQFYEWKKALSEMIKNQ